MYTVSLCSACFSVCLNNPVMVTCQKHRLRTLILNTAAKCMSAPCTFTQTHKWIKAAIGFQNQNMCVWGGGGGGWVAKSIVWGGNNCKTSHLTKNKHKLINKHIASKSQKIVNWSHNDLNDWNSQIKKHKHSNMLPKKNKTTSTTKQKQTTTTTKMKCNSEWKQVYCLNLIQSSVYTVTIKSHPIHIMCCNIRIRSV